MKKSVFLSLLALVTFFQFALAATNPADVDENNPGTAIRSLIVNANVTVVLMSGQHSQPEQIGDAVFMQLVSVKQTNGVLVINTKRDRNFKGRGIVYVPASSLENVRINGSADIKSSGILDIPNLAISINGDCRVHIFTTGKVSPESSAYEFDLFTRDLFAPGAPLLSAGKK
jgi:hypothetical protein